MFGMKTKTVFPKYKNKSKALRQRYSLLDCQYTFPEFICRYHMSHENEAILSKL